MSQVNLQVLCQKKHVLVQCFWIYCPTLRVFAATQFRQVNDNDDRIECERHHEREEDSGAPAMSLAARGVADVAASLTVGAVRAAGRGKPTVVS
ncbi:hypothetical protein NLY43_13090 [Mesorhizobium sp. C416B]|uniref:hypothetical protein n=1 Tax=unclassified Mesorhizobium TaxID=325217 RepID=UPI0012EB89CE|nr:MULTISPECIES: hypothetical protein [unclassified Mesorhizobium]WJI65557.1 hypothetical protein NLY43_13090 [Mesorhizobium sp. C416B]